MVCHRAVWILVLALLAGTVSSSGAASERRGLMIAFGSCSKQWESQPLWPRIEALHPKVWLWLGDNIYGDRPRSLRRGWDWPGAEHLKECYRIQQEEQLEYKEMVEDHKMPIIGVYDDHDFGWDNVGKEFPEKEFSRGLFLDFMGIPNDDPIRFRAGAYSSHNYGTGDRRVKIIILDTRYHRDPIGSDGSVLGEEQWAWLEEEMELDGGNGDVPPPALIIIASSIQVIPNYTIYVQPFATVESWNLFPSEQSRLFDLVKRASSRKPSPYRVVFLSGDVHLGAISRIPRGCREDYGQDLVDVTSSGMTHTVTDMLAAMSARSWSGLLENNMTRPWMFPKPYEQSLYVEINFGTVYVDWESNTITMDVRNETGDAVLSTTLSLDPRDDEIFEESDPLCLRESELPLFRQYRIVFVVGTFLGLAVCEKYWWAIALVAALIIFFISTLSQKMVMRRQSSMFLKLTNPAKNL